MAPKQDRLNRLTRQKTTRLKAHEGLQEERVFVIFQNLSPDLSVGCCAFRKDQELLPGFSGCRITPGSMIYKNE